MTRVRLCRRAKDKIVEEEGDDDAAEVKDGKGTFAQKEKTIVEGLHESEDEAADEEDDNTFADEEDNHSEVSVCVCVCSLEVSCPRWTDSPAVNLWVAL